MERAPAAREESGRIQQLLDELRELLPGPAWERVEELVQRLLALQGDAVGRLLTHARACGADGALDARLVEDELVSSVLLLHGLHPLPAEERIRRALAELRPQLAARGMRAELLGISGGVAQLLVAGDAAAVQRAVLEAAPELSRVEIQEPQPLVSLRVAT
jgi:hypothetical protein